MRVHRVAGLSAFLGLTLVPGIAVRGAVVSGVVTDIAAPIPLAKVTLYKAGDTKGAGASELGTTFANGQGEFTLTYPAPSDPNAVLYMIADGPTSSTRLATVLGTSPFEDDVTINERTTVATAYAMAQFIVGDEIGGNTPGIQNAASTLQNLVDLRTGNIGDVLGSRPNGSETNTMALFNSLANLVTSCAVHQSCDELFALATPPGGTAPENTLDAMVDIAHYPWHNATELFTIAADVKIYEPALTLPPVTWTIALLYEGNGRMFDGPGATAFDAEGNAWINNNYTFRKNHNTRSCGGKQFFKLLPNGENAPHSPFNGRRGGVDGAGFGICVDAFNNIWIGNFGFYGTTCPCKIAPLANSVSKYTMDGTALCPREGFTQGCINGPQATVSDMFGNIWIANCCGGTVTQYRLGNPEDNWVFDIHSLSLAPPGSCPAYQGNKPFGIAIDADGNGWVTDNRANTAFKLATDGTLLAMADSSAGIDRPMGVAIDSTGDVWISNSHIVDPPCATCGSGGGFPYKDVLDGIIDPSVTRLDSDGNLVGVYRGGGMWIPWGICVDGADNVWVANFGGRRVTELDHDGNPVAPLGYYSDAMQRITGVSIDPSGNVWLANNWLIDPPLTNPGGDGMLVFVGLAAPVKTPMFGPPEQP